MGSTAGAAGTVGRLEARGVGCLTGEFAISSLVNCLEVCDRGVKLLGDELRNGEVGVAATGLRLLALLGRSTFVGDAVGVVWRRDEEVGGVGSGRRKGELRWWVRPAPPPKDEVLTWPVGTA